MKQGSFILASLFREEIQTMKTLAKICCSLTIAFLLSLAIWYVLLIDIPEDFYVQGMAAPAMTKEEALNLMHYHGVKVVYVKNGKLIFDRDGKTIPLKRK